MASLQRPQNQRHVVITGALGHIGSALIRDPLLTSEIGMITMIDNLSTQRFSSVFSLPERSSFRLLIGDVEAVLNESLLEDVDSVIHLAGAVDQVRSFQDPGELQRNNLRITKHVVNVCSNTRTPLVFPSSTSVYTPAGPTVDETSIELHPVSSYAQCKLEEESLIRTQLEETGFTIFRLGTIFGPSPGMQFHTAVNKFCWQAINGMPLEIWRTALSQYRPYLQLTDCTALLTQTVTRRRFLNQVLNAASCNATVSDVLASIREYGLSLNLAMSDSQAMNNFSFSVSTNLARNHGYMFTGRLRDGIFETLDLIRALSTELY